MSPRVLVVDDDTDLADILLIALRARGYEVRAAGDGRSALATLERWRPDLITLDLLMPDFDGWDFLAEQRSGPNADVPVLILTGVLRPECYRQDLAVPIMSKPFRLSELLANVALLTGQTTNKVRMRPTRYPAAHDR